MKRIFAALALTFALVFMFAGSSFAQVLPPQGRLTLTSNTPVMTSDVVGASTLYYTPYVGNSLPISNGTSLSNGTFSQLSLNVAGAATTGQIRDVYAIYVSSNFVLCLSNVWNSTSARGTVGAPAPAPIMLQGIWVNATAMTSGCETPSNNYTVPAQQGIYLGTIFTAEHPAGLGGGTLGVTVQFTPSAEVGGTQNLIGIWNAYNRVPVFSMESDSSYNYTTTSTSWQPLDDVSNPANSVTYVDGLGQSSVKAKVTCMGWSSLAGTNIAIGLAEDTTSPTFPISYAVQLQPSPGNSAVGATTISAEENFTPLMGLHYIQALQASLNGATLTLGVDQITFMNFQGEY